MKQNKEDEWMEMFVRYNTSLNFVACLHIEYYGTRKSFKTFCHYGMNSRTYSEGCGLVYACEIEENLHNNATDVIVERKSFVTFNQLMLNSLVHVHA